MISLLHLRRLVLSISFFLFSISVMLSQGIICDVDHDARHIYDRMIILSGGPPEKMHSSIFPYWRSDLIELIKQFNISGVTKEDLHNIQSIADQNNEFLVHSDSLRKTNVHYADSTKTFYYLEDNEPAVSYYRLSKRPFLKTFYKTPANLYEVDVKDFYLRVNPLIRVGVGRETNEDVTTFINQRGLSLRGGIG